MYLRSPRRYALRLMLQRILWILRRLLVRRHTDPLPGDLTRFFHQKRSVRGKRHADPEDDKGNDQIRHERGMLAGSDTVRNGEAQTFGRSQNARCVCEDVDVDVVGS